jgi:hypothetical protein
METIGKVLAHRRNPKRKATSERGELIQYFTDRINAHRDGEKYPKLPARFIAVKLSHIKSLSDLYYMKSIMEDMDRRGGNPSRWFWWSLKPHD